MSRPASRFTIVSLLLLWLLVAATVADEPVAPVPPEATGVWLGLWLGDAVDGGLSVVDVVEGGPASRAGLRRGDVMLEVASRPVLVRAELAQVLNGLTAGDSIDVVVVRAGELVKKTIQLGQRRTRTLFSPAPLAAPAPPAAVAPLHRIESSGRRPALGLRVVETTPALRAHYGAPEDAGVLVVRIEPDTPAARAGIRVGDVLIRFGGSIVQETAQLETRLTRWDRAQPIEAELIRGGEPVVARLSARAAAPFGRGPGVDSQQRLREHRVRLEIERLERRLAELRRELAALGEQPRDER